MDIFPKSKEKENKSEGVYPNEIRFELNNKYREDILLISQRLNISSQSVYFGIICLLVHLYTDENEINLEVLSSGNPVIITSSGLTIDDYISSLSYRNPLVNQADTFCYSENKFLILSFETQKYLWRNEQETNKYDVIINARIDNFKPYLFIKYNNIYYSEKIFDMFKKHLENLIVMASHGGLISDVNFILVEEQRIIGEFNNTKYGYDIQEDICSLFDKQVFQGPNTTAVILNDMKITYKELRDGTIKIATYIYPLVEKETLVAIIMDRGVEVISTILAVLRVGGVYVPIDSTTPSERITTILETYNINIILTSNKHRSLINKINKNLIAEHVIYIQDYDEYGVSECNITNLFNEDYSLNSNNSFPNIDSHQLAYVIFTSGSTGVPKGVMIEHKALTNFVYGIVKAINFPKETVMLNLTSVAFDIFVLETLVPLTQGQTIMVASENATHFPRIIDTLIQKYNVNVLQMTPSRLFQFFKFSKEFIGFSKLKVVLVGGEQLTTNLLDHIFRFTEAEIYNLYGPTETTVWSSVKKLSKNNGITIGKPLPNTEILILDKRGKVRPIGFNGEICILGGGLARGYIQDHETTRAKFVNFDGCRRIYKTGDIGRFLDSGEIECLGRLDNQLKVNGFRVELGDIENNLLYFESIKEATVVVKEEEHGLKHIVAFYTSEIELNNDDIKAFLSRTLPSYMIPIYFIRIYAMPLTISGKVDRKRLLVNLFEEEEYNFESN